MVQCYFRSAEQPVFRTLVAVPLIAPDEALCPWAMVKLPALELPSMPRTMVRIADSMVVVAVPVEHLVEERFVDPSLVEDLVLLVEADSMVPDHSGTTASLTDHYY